MTTILGRKIRIPVPGRYWTPRYILNRIHWGLWQRRNPDAPWLVPGAVRFLEQWLRPTDTMVEFGSGRSTVWFANRVQHLISVEHDEAWHAKVSTQLKESMVRNVDYFRAAPEPSEYLAPPSQALDAEADVILVDGASRDTCANWALSRITPGGIIIVDNANWFLPSQSSAPASIGLEGSPKTPEWAQFRDAVDSWRRVWFSSGVTDTLVLFAPVARTERTESSDVARKPSASPTTSP